MNDTLTLYQELADRLQQREVPDKVNGLVLAAFQGDEPLDAVVRGDALPVQPEAGEVDGGRPQAFLEEIRIAGFRGVGQPATVGLVPKTGLTVFIGRNGSGKSSFAEAVEFTLTEDSLRWAQRPQAFRDGWRNLHHHGAPEIRLTMRLDTGEPVTINRTWPAGTTDLASATVTTTQGDAAMSPGQLPEWISQADRYRPFLSARDLERVITARPTELYDAIAPILGLAPLAAADARLQRERKLYDDRAKALKADFAQLRAQLAQVDDERARDALLALGTRAGRADLTGLGALASDEVAASEAVAAAAARRLTEEKLPDGRHILVTLVEEHWAAKEAAATDSGMAHRAAELLRGALEMHRDGGDRPCPVCRQGTLDHGWRQEAESEVARLAAVAAAASVAQDEYAKARRTADTLLGDVHKWLDPVADELAAHLPAQCAAMRDALAGLGHDPATWDALDAAHASLAAAATDWLTQRHDAWREPGAAIRRWVDAATLVRAEAATLGLLNKARDELGVAAKAIRAERLGSYAAQSDRVWRQLRHESNVELHQLRMDGNNTSRKVRFPVAVDGVETDALGVMSQGELHALGLAVFLPRACADASPYRFVIIDDPVQSMDPAKIDGLAEVLREVALTRQVVVFTHDDRLPEALRRLDVEADIREVTRREGSIVEVRRACDPADRYLDDARAIVKADIPNEVKDIMVAGYCRSAIEAVSMDRYRLAQHRAGTPYQRIQERLGDAHGVKDVLSLGLFGGVVPRQDLFARLDREYGRKSTRTVKAVAAAVHGAPSEMSIGTMVDNTTALVRRLR
ncbi:AAA family ATPase [Solwaraspora sp. WMMD937]|uniref:AAA family ATPase n=1 Tax=Solwaraspora sp. WMMD937 TaxID=3016090 RepID=UPI00249C6088|nr:AAA family ATPase [Solwaraspora sp. WMMD937]WFE22484.1 AAA family ATPase [Solwaraspora sp. WMMD937]